MRTPDTRDELLTPGLLRNSLTAPGGRANLERLAASLHIRNPDRMSDYELVGEVVSRLRAEERAAEKRRLLG